MLPISITENITFARKLTQRHVVSSSYLAYLLFVYELIISKEVKCNAAHSVQILKQFIGLH